MIENIFNPIQKKGWVDAQINEKGRNVIVSFLFNMEFVLHVIT